MTAMAVVDRKMFATIVNTLKAICVKIPDELSFNEAATMFFSYATAMYFLMNVGDLRKGQVCNSLRNSPLFSVQFYENVICPYS